MSRHPRIVVNAAMPELVATARTSWPWGLSTYSRSQASSSSRRRVAVTLVLVVIGVDSARVPTSRRPHGMADRRGMPVGGHDQRGGKRLAGSEPVGVLLGGEAAKERRRRCPGGFPPQLLQAAKLRTVVVHLGAHGSRDLAPRGALHVGACAVEFDEAASQPRSGGRADGGELRKVGLQILQRGRPERIEPHVAHPVGACRYSKWLGSGISQWPPQVKPHRCMTSTSRGSWADS